jgi:outer membrane receptor protein involved in Fe transport
MTQKYRLLAILFCISYLFASGGKITGQIRSLETNEPLPGVNVIIEEVLLGAASDQNGMFFILNVPTGNYTLSASYIGYSKYVVQELRVSLGQTTEQDFQLTQEIIEGKEIIVLAERPLVQKDLTASQRITTSDEMKNLPVESFLGILTTQAGVNQGAGGEIHIRGGRSNEVGYYIDGVSVANPFFTNSLAVNISNKALDEMKVVSGAFNAEYGNAMSGIVNLQIKEGGSDYHGSMSIYSGDYFSNGKDIFLNIDDIDPKANTVYEGSINGPVRLFSRGNKLTFNVSGRYSDSQGHLYGQREHKPDDYADFRVSDYWMIELGGDKKYVPMNPSQRSNILSKLTYRFTPKIKLSAQLIQDKRDWKSYTHSYKYNPDGIYNHFTQNNNYSLRLTQAFTRSYYEVNIFNATTDFKQFLFEDPNDERYVSTNRILGSPPTTTFVFGGTQMGHYSRESITKGGKFDFTSQVTTKHEIKVGISARSDKLEEDNYSILYDGYEYSEPTVLPANESPSHNYYDKQALIASSYIQDKIEYPDMILNVGIRYDFFDPNDKYIADLIHPEEERIQATKKSMVSPRLGVSFPITNEGVLHFSYGHFYQIPTLRRLYKASIFGANISPTIGNANLKPEKTVLYEFGLQQQFTKVLAIDATVFYKDIRDLLALQSIDYLSPTYGPASYSIYMNKDFGNVKGFTLSLIKRRDPITKTSAFLDYSYQITKGNSVTSGSFYFNALTGEEEEKKIVPLSWDQRNVMNATITISEPRKWGISFIGKLAQGWPYTPNIPFANYVPNPNSERKPWQKNVDIRIHKNLNIGNIDIVVFGKIYNLFDFRNERYVFSDTGKAGYTFVNKSSQETEAFTSHYGEPGVHRWEEYQVRPNYYSSPRSVQFGLSIDF